MNQKRAELQKRLDALAARAGAPAAQPATIALLRTKLGASQIYPADIAFVDGQLSELEAAFQLEASQPDKHWPRSATLAVILALLAGLALLVLLLVRKRPAAGGLARYKHAEARINRLLAQGLSDRETAA